MARTRQPEGPLGFRQLKRKKAKEPTQSPPPLVRVNAGSLVLPSGVRPTIARDWSGGDSYRIVAELTGAQVETLGTRAIGTVPLESMPETRLSARMADGFEEVAMLAGSYPSHARLSYLPGASQLDLELLRRFRRRHPKDDLPTNVFGTDDRYVYDDSSFPWRTVGRVWTAAGVCAGCTIGPRLVLTGSHCINWTSGGGAGWAKFSPAYYNGNGPWGEFHATRVIYWNRAEGGLSDLETAFDYAVLVMDEHVGNMVGYPGYRTYSDAWNGDEVWQHMGYPGDLTSGERPAFQGSCTISSTSSESLSGQSGLVLGHFNDVTGGHSGGPVWGWWSGEDWPRVVGVQSAEASVPAYDTSGDNEFGGGAALSALIGWARSNYP